MADYSVLCEKQQIEIGKAGENLARSCTIDYSAWLKEYGEGDLRIRAIRSGDAEPYPVTNVTTENGVATWTFTDADTAAKGYGEVQILYYVEDVLVKSRVWRTYTHRSLSTSSEEVPDPYQDWLSEVERIGSQIEEDVESASDSATRAAGSASEAAESALSATRSESSAQGYASEASTSAASAASSASAASQSASEASTYEYYSEQYMNEAKSARLSAESARTGAENAKTAAQAAATESEASATAAAQSAAQAEETAESIEASADLIQKLLANQIHDTATGTIASFPDGADMPMVSLVADIDPIQDLHGYDRPWVGGGGASKIPFESVIEEGWTRTLNGITATFSKGYMKVTGTSTSSGWTNIVDLTPWASPDFFYLPAGTYSVAEHLTIKGYADGTYANFSEVGRTVTQQFNVMGFYIAVRSGETVDWNVPMMFVSGSTRPTAYEPYSNICPISGWDSVDVSVAGINVWDEEWEVGGIRSSDGTNSTDANRIRAKNLIPIVETTYYVKAPSNLTAFYYDMNNDFMESKPIGSNTTFIPINGAKYMRFTVGSSSNPVTTYNNDISINYPSTDHDYHAHEGQTYQTTLPQTVYGGTLDVVGGVLTVDRAMVDLGTLNWTYQANYQRFTTSDIYQDVAKPPNNNTQTGAISSVYVESTSNKTANPNYDKTFGISDGGSVQIRDEAYTDATALQTSLTGQTMVYFLATPTTIQLTPTQIDSLLGRNNVWSDSVDVTVEYIANTKLYIQKVMGAIG